MLCLVDFEVLVAVVISDIFELLEIVLGCLADRTGFDDMIFEGIVFFA